jgi:hypothetical protein
LSVEINGTGKNTVEINGDGGHELYSYHDSGGVGWCTGAGAGNYGELLYFSESGSDIQIYVVGESSAVFNGNGSVDLYYDNSKKFETHSNGVTVTGRISVSGNSGVGLIHGDSVKAVFGDSDDLEIYHDGSNSSIKNSTGQLSLLSDEFGVCNEAFSENIIRGTANGSVRLYYDHSEKCRTHSTGLLVNRTGNDGNAPLQVAEGSGLGISVATGSTSTKTMVEIRNPNGVVGTIKCANSNTSFNTSSDYRLKENEVAISDGITRLKTLKPYRFNFKVDPDTTVDGFFAHEVTPAVPEAITGEKDGTEMQGIDQSKLVPLLTAALQEAISKIETLETKVAALESS